jgi:hypothetical protein
MVRIRTRKRGYILFYVAKMKGENINE